MKQKFKAACLALMVSATPSLANATQIMLNPANVIASSGDYDARFAAGNIFNQQVGIVDETMFERYWITPDPGQADTFITIDLLSSYKIASVDLFNSRNVGGENRGTGDFKILAGNVLGPGFSIVHGIELFSGTLLPESGLNPAVLKQSFLAQNNGAFRYLQFRPTSVGALRPSGPYSYGLDEMRLFQSVQTPGGVPEPATWALIIAGFGLVGFSMRVRKPRQIASA